MMPFPAIERVIYKRNPLVDVTFQARFPKLLSIEAELPADFQKLIIADYPVYEQRNVVQVHFAVGGINRATPNEVTGKIHAFVSGDKNRTVSLASDSISLSLRTYVCWEDFRRELLSILDQFIAVYTPQNFTRINLQYQNLIRRESLGLEGSNWAELLGPHIAGELTTRVVPEDAFINRHVLLTMKMTDGDLIQLQHGLIRHTESQKVAYLINGDFINSDQRVANRDNIREAADRLHANSSGLFRWCISEKLHTAMEPRRPDRERQ